MPSALSLTFPQSGIALITFDLPDKGANILSLSVLQELAALLDQLQSRKELASPERSSPGPTSASFWRRSAPPKAKSWPCAAAGSSYSSGCQNALS
jgi:hypothetical protein